MMKNIAYSIKALVGLCLSALVISFAGCTAEDTYVTNYLKLWDSSVTLPADGHGLLFVIGVESSSKWSAKFEAEGDWLYEAASTDKGFTVAARPNINNTERNGKIIFSNGYVSEEFIVTQTAASTGIPNEKGVAPVYVSFPIYDLSPLLMSANGEYIVGVKSEISGYSNINTPVRIEVKTGKRTEFETLPPAPKMYPTAVSNDGSFVISYEGAYECLLIDGDGNVSSPMVNGYEGALIHGMSDDGKTWVGAVFSEMTFQWTPVKWVNGTPQLLKIFDKDHYDNDNTYGPGYQADGCSADGSVVYGTEIYTFFAVYWDQNGDIKYIGEDVIDGIIKNEGGFFNSGYFSHIVGAQYPFSLSPDGKYFTSMYRYLNYQEFEMDIYYPVVYDFATEKSTVLYEFSGNEAEGVTISNNGLLSIGLGRVYDTNKKEVYNTGEWIEQKYGLKVNRNPVIERFSTDGNTVLGKYREGIIGYTFFYIYYPES